MSKIDNEKIFRGMNYIGPDLIEEAEELIKHERKNNIIWLRRVGQAAGGLAAAFAILVGMCAASPALAAKIPFIGALFQQSSDKTGMISRNLENYGVIQPIHVEAKTENPDLRMTATEAYSDGNIIQIGLELTVPESLTERYDDLVLAAGQNGAACTAAVNGEETTFESVGLFSKLGDVWGAVIRINVPESQKAADTLNTVFTLRGLEEWSGKETVEGEFAFEISVDANKSHTVRFASDAEDNGAKVLGVEATPAMTIIRIEKPYWGDVSPAYEDGSIGDPVLYADGKEMQRSYTKSAEVGGYDRMKKEPQTADLYFDGLPTAAKKAELKFTKSVNDRSAVYAVFTIDLKGRTVTPGNTPAKEVVTYEQTSYRSLGRGEIQNHMTIGCVEITQTNGVWQAGLGIEFEPGTEVPPLSVEIANEKDEIVFSSSSHLPDGSLNPQWGTGIGENGMLLSYFPLITLDEAAESGDIPRSGEGFTVLVRNCTTHEVLLKEYRTFE